VLALLGITALGAALRSFQAGESLWVDELHTSWTVADGIGEIAWRARIGNQSPLFFYSPWLSTRLFGPSEAALRLTSILAGVLLIPLLFWVVWRTAHSAPAALLAAFVAAVDVYLILFSLEARPYSTLQLAAVIQFLLLLRVLEFPTWPRRIAWVVSCGAIFHLHYTGALFLASQWAVLLAIVLGRGKSSNYRVRSLAVDSLVLLGLCLPVGGHVLRVAARRANWEAFIPQSPAAELFTIIPLHVYLAAPLALLLMALAVRLFGRRPSSRERAPESRQAPAVCLAVGGCLLPLAIAWAATHADLARLFFLRYMTPSLAMGAVAAGLLCSLVRPALARWVCAAALAAYATYWIGPDERLWSSGHVVDHAGEDWRGASDWLNEHHRGEPIFVYSGLIEADALRWNKSERLESYCQLPLGGLYRVETHAPGEPAEAAAQSRPLVSGLPFRPLGPLRYSMLSPEQYVQWKTTGKAWFLVRGDAAWAARVIGWSGRATISRQKRFRGVMVVLAELVE